MALGFFSYIENLVVCCSIQVKAISKEWANRADLPGHVVTMLNNFPSNLHPMAQFSAAITACNSESKYAKAYSDGAHKSTYWEVGLTFNPLSPHDALKHHFTSLKTDLIFLKLRVLDRKFP